MRVELLHKRSARPSWSTCWPRSHAADVRMPDLLWFFRCLRGLPFHSGVWRGRPSSEGNCAASSPGVAALGRVAVEHLIRMVAHASREHWR